MFSLLLSSKVNVLNDLITGAVKNYRLRQSVYNSSWRKMWLSSPRVRIDCIYDYQVWEYAISVAGRLSKKNPAYVLPALRRYLIQLHRVTDDQFYHVLFYELLEIYEAYAALWLNCEPLVTFVVVQKRKHTAKRLPGYVLPLTAVLSTPPCGHLKTAYNLELEHEKERNMRMYNLIGFNIDAKLETREVFSRSSLLANLEHGLLFRLSYSTKKRHSFYTRHIQYSILSFGGCKSASIKSDIYVLMDSETILLPDFISTLSYVHKLNHDWLLYFVLYQLYAFAST
ncbi:eukaryotic translation initiation factor 3 subunit A-like protein [Tanacetum coccineum]